ncbi:hypothetical protein [Paenibacillus glycinis]|uniref:Uncharacterized protein n=1 Tax=Paenibacillus glycinis TaxID=2697035 RepID=A0ABW9XLF6_9BACL|nr:hypothetical protein [Paenibacillus glycinis]NBD23277.1 hypothetical protein [Paenibacillus glycinis]
MKKTSHAIALLAAVIGLSGPIGGQLASASGASPEWTYQDGYKDPVTGRSYYRAAAYERQQYVSRVVYADGSGNWYALPKPYWGFGVDNANGALRLYGNGDYLDSIGSSLYSPSHDLVTRRIDYDERSPDGKWELKVGEHYTIGSERNATGKRLLAFVKRTGDGTVREFSFTAFYSGVFWLPDNRLLAHVYSEEKRQNEIVALDPATGTTTPLVVGSFYGYDAKSGSIEFAYNEPTRKPWIYSLKTGRTRPYTKQDEPLFQAPSRPEPTSPAPLQPAAVPADLQPDNLPVAPLTESTEPEAVAVINRVSVELPAAFLEGNTGWIALQPLQHAFGVKAEKLEQYPIDRQFRLSLQGKSLFADLENSRNYGGRLYVNKSLLQKLGLKLEQLQWIP